MSIAAAEAEDVTALLDPAIDWNQPGIAHSVQLLYTIVGNGSPLAAFSQPTLATFLDRLSEIARPTESLSVYSGHTASRTYLSLSSPRISPHALFPYIQTLPKIEHLHTLFHFQH